MNRAALVLAALILLLAVPEAHAQTKPKPGDACASIVANDFTWSTGQQRGGVDDGMFCNTGGTYTGIINFQSTGNIGIGTTSPQATLDINGYQRLAKNSAAPVACTSTNDGAIALTASYMLCVCNGGSGTWVQDKDGTTACSWPYPTYTGPGDVVSGAKAWWGLRAYSQSYAASGGKAINIRRTSDGTAKDITVLSTGALDVATASSFCSSTTCYVTEAYDQTGNSNNVTQTTTSAQPQLLFNCIGSLPCLQFTGSSSQTLNVTLSVNQPYTLSATGYTTSSGATQQAVIASSTGSSGFWGFVSGYAEAVAGTYSVQQAISTSTFYAMQGVYSGSPSGIYVNGTATTGTLGTNALGTTTGWGSWGGAGGYLTGRSTEAGVWGSAFTTTQQSSMNSNQRSYWGF